MPSDTAVGAYASRNLAKATLLSLKERLRPTAGGFQGQGVQSKTLELTAPSPILLLPRTLMLYYLNNVTNLQTGYL